MAFSFAAGAVVYAKNVSAVAAFYAEVAGLRTVYTEPGLTVLESPGFQLVVVAIPPGIAASIQLSSPPRRREDTAVKLVLPVLSLAAARAAAQSFGGELNSSEREWKFQDCRVCDGHDPEGNVVQFRESFIR